MIKYAKGSSLTVRMIKKIKIVFYHITKFYYQYININACKFDKLIERYRENVILPINTEKLITLYTDYALPLCVILSNNENKSWFYQYFIQIYSGINHNVKYFAITYVDCDETFKEVLNTDCIRLNEIKNIRNIVEYIISKLNENYYIIVNIDEYFIKNKCNYQVEHFYHKTLIYGFSIKERELLAIGFDSKQFFTDIKISFDELQESYNYSRIDRDDYPIFKLLSLKQTTNCTKFNIERFINELHNYIFSVKEGYEDSKKLSYIEGNRAFGINAYYDLIYQLENFNTVEYQPRFHDFHIFWEHRRGIYDRLKYLMSQYKLSDKSKQLINEYSQIVHNCNTIRNKYIKIVLSGKNEDFYKPIENIDDLLYLAKLMRNVLCDEEILLKSILENLKCDLQILTDQHII